MEGLKVSDAELVVYIHPSKANKVKQAILRQLSSLLFQFNEAFDGVVLAYDVNIESKKAKILTGIFPYFGVRLKAKLLVFSPVAGMLLEGKVVKVGKESIHVIVLGFSSAAIASEDIREEFEYKIKHDEGVFASTSHKRHVIKGGSMVRFLVKSFDVEILHISGSLVPLHTGCVQWLYKNNMVDGHPMERSLRKKRENVVVLEESSQLDGGALTSSMNLKKLKRKRTVDEL